MINVVLETAGGDEQRAYFQQLPDEDPTIATAVYLFAGFLVMPRRR